MSIFKTLEELGLTSASTREVYSFGTRDKTDLTVWKDQVSGVIYIDDFYIGDITYEKGDYRKTKQKDLKTGAPDFERLNDAQRRLQDYLPLIAGKHLMDFGCGRGEFLLLAEQFCQKVTGVDLQEDFLAELRGRNIECETSLTSIKCDSLDICVMFHSLEHLLNPKEFLQEIRLKLRSGGRIIVEVPHANDFLLSGLDLATFKNFTLWSQHLILHTRESLRRLLEAAGFKNVLIKGTQRYPLSNHLTWLNAGRPGGHKGHLSIIDTAALTDAYSDALASIDATDTLTAIAEKI